MSRNRKATPLSTKLAAALACLLPQDQRDFLRAGRVSLEAVLSRFHFDHIVPHADGGSDEWWNLDPLLLEIHKEKTAKVDIPRIAKGKRIVKKEALHQAIMAGETVGPGSRWLRRVDNKKERPRQRWPSRPFNSRGKAPGKQRPTAPKILPRRGL